MEALEFSLLLAVIKEAAEAEDEPLDVILYLYDHSTILLHNYTVESEMYSMALLNR